MSWEVSSLILFRSTLQLPSLAPPIIDQSLNFWHGHIALSLLFSQKTRKHFFLLKEYLLYLCCCGEKCFGSYLGQTIPTMAGGLVSDCQYSILTLLQYLSICIIELNIKIFIFHESCYHKSPVWFPCLAKTTLKWSTVDIRQYMISWGIEVRMKSFQARMNSFQTRRNLFYAEGRLEWNHSSLE